MTPEQFAARCAELETQLGVPMHGDTGQISKSSVTAKYSYGQGKLTVEIVQKPFLVSTAFCESRLLSWLAGS